MYINRARALLLVGTIAAAGCAAANGDEEETDENSGDPSGNGGAGPGGAGMGAVGGQAAVGGAEQGGNGGNPVAGGGSSQGGMNTAGTTSEGSYSCDDESAILTSCDDLQSVACEGWEDFLDPQCGMAGALMKPGIANIARGCMIALEPPDLCEPLNTYACMDEALSLSCPDVTADDECASIVAICAESLVDVAPASCSTVLSGMTQAGRDQMVQCMATLCDLYVCMEGLVYPAVE